MRTPLQWFRRRPASGKDEASNSFAIFITLMPVILGAFGLGIDMSRNVYIRTTLQNSLDMATVAGAGVTTINPNGQVVIVKNSALRTVRQVYARNRHQGPGSNCWGPGTRVPGTPYRQCWRDVSSSVSANRLSYSIRERSRNAFLPIIGIEYQTYRVTSRARVNQEQQ